MVAHKRARTEAGERFIAPGLFFCVERGRQRGTPSPSDKELACS